MRGLNPEVNYLNSCEIKIHFEILNKIKIKFFYDRTKTIHIYLFYLNSFPLWTYF